MPVTPTYPGIYIEELPLSTHTVQAAPTSIAVFIGYVNPWYTASTKGAGFTQPVGAASQNATAATVLYGFSDYEANFGGMFTSGLVDASLPRAVNQFFANGGSQAYVVGLLPQLYDDKGALVATFLSGGAAFTATVAASTPSNCGLVFTAQQFADQVAMTLIVSNVRVGLTPNVTDTFDVSIIYGSTIETYRGVTIGASAATSSKTAVWNVINKQSVLAQVAPLTAGYGTALSAPTSGPSSTYPFTCSLLQPNPPANFATCFLALDFVAQMQEGTSLDQLEIFNLLLVPGVSDNTVQSTALAFAERKLAFALLDPPPTATISGKEAGLKIDGFASNMPRSQNGAVYFPWLNSTDTVTTNPVQIAPSGYVAGVCAKTDVARGVWKAPAGMATNLLYTSGPAAGGLLTDDQQGELNITQAVNCLRQFASIGTVVFGSRTLVGNNDAYAQSKYVPVRRMTLFLEQSLRGSLRWAVFEPNDTPLWTAIKLEIESFLIGIWNQGGLQGSKPAQAFQVKCDSSTTTPDDQQNGIVNIVVAFAPLKPAEFVILQIAQLAGQTSS